MPFDRRRHGMIVGMGAAALVVESAEVARERGLQPICEVLSTVTLNSAFHGTRLDVTHVAGTMEQLIAKAERRGIDRDEIAPETVFISHETYTPARARLGAPAEVTPCAASSVPATDKIVIANTKGFTGHAMGVGIEDVVAVKALETGIVPPVPNFQELDPDLGSSTCRGAVSTRSATRCASAAGFGSQIAMALLRWTPMPSGQRTPVDQLGYQSRILDAGVWQQWLDHVTGKPGSTLEVVDRRLRVVDDASSASRSTAPAAPAATAATPAPAPVPTQAPVPAAAPAPPPPPPPPAPEPVAAIDPVVDKVVAIVSGMTGYPPELLDVDLDLEADLGVDTVKQAEVFAAVREEFGVERDPNLQLRDFPTLTHVIGWVRDKAGIPEAAPAAAAPAAPAPAAAPAAAPPVPAADAVVDKVVAIVAEMTGYPPELLDVDLDLEADLGVDTVKQAEVFAAVREEFGVERDPNLQLRDFPTLTHVVGWVRDKTGIAEALAAATRRRPGCADRACGDPCLAPASRRRPTRWWRRSWTSSPR